MLPKICNSQLLERLRVHFGIRGKVLQWLKSYLEDRTFSVKIKDCFGRVVSLLFGVPQGSILGPLLFILYCKHIESIAHKYGLQIQLYADDFQLYIELKPGCNALEMKLNIESCLAKIRVGCQLIFSNSMKLKLI